MNNVVHRVAALVVACAMILGGYIDTQAAGSSYYVSATGDDANPGTASAPFRTFAKASSVLSAGSTLYIQPGIYTEPLKLSKSGTAGEWIRVEPAGGQVVIDMQSNPDAGVVLRGSYISVSGLEVRNSGNVCVNLVGSHLRVENLTVHECTNHGIQADSSVQVEILNNRVYHASMLNASRNMSSGWASGIKVLVSGDVLIQGNTVYHNYGEGMGTRGTNVTIRGNTVYDNYSVNIYTNSENALIEGNFVYCTPGSGFERDGLPAIGIALAEEYFEGWGARLKNARVINNIVAFCKHGVRYNGADDLLTGGGLKNATIAYNTLYGSTNSALSIVYEPAQAGSLIANNIIWQAENKLSYINNTAGLTFQNNLWKVLPPVGLRGPGDRIGDPGFAGSPGYAPEGYRPGSASPAIGGGADTGIPVDFFGAPRGPSFDMGAVQYSGSRLDPTPLATNTSAPATAAPTAILPPATNTAQPVQEAIYNDKDSAFVYSPGWKNVSTSRAYKGSYKQTTRNDATVTFTFTGQSFSILYKGGVTFSKFDVYVDGVLVGTLDQKLAATAYQQRWDYTGQLASGRHTLKLVFKVTSSTINKGSLDAVIVR